MSRWDEVPDEATDHPRTRREIHHGRRHPVLRAVLATVSLLLVAAIVFVGVAIWKLDNNVQRVDVSTAVGTDRPTAPARAAEALNILVLGSDTRKGLSTDDFGKDTIEGGDHSDTNILIHISADRRSVLAVSIPRDSMVPAPPDCSPTVPRNEWRIRQWNTNYTNGGTGCTIRTLEGNTGVFVDHYAVVNFEGFRDMVDALGGVDVCTPVAINDPASDLKLDAGWHTLDGHEALGYVRARKTLGDGSDIGRIKRQQAFMSSVAQKAVSTEMLKRPDRLFGFLNAATKALTTDPAMGLSVMSDVARSLQDIGPENIQFVTVPIEEYAPDPNRVQWADNAELIWKAIRNDQVIGAPDPTPEPTPSDSPTQLTVSPDRIAVQVLNGTGVKGLAGQARTALLAQGFVTVDVGDAPAATGVVVAHSRYQADAARTVAAAFPGAVLQLDNTLGDIVQVTLGAGAPAVVEIPNRLGTTPLPTPSISAPAVGPSPTPSASPSGPPIQTRTADESICS